jgi:uncharacterized membrane protein YoaK (UPF0700 family)
MVIRIGRAPAIGFEHRQLLKSITKKKLALSLTLTLVKGFFGNMAISKVKKVTTNALIYLTCAFAVAVYGWRHAEMHTLALAMFMVQVAHFFKRPRRSKCKKRHLRAEGADIAASEVVVTSAHV